MSEWSIPAVIDAVTEAVPDREMLVWTSVRRTYAEVQATHDAARRVLPRAGLGVRRERSELARWECGQSPVAILLSNCPEYVETMLGAYRARAVPFNVNHHYNAAEVAQLLDQIGARGDRVPPPARAAARGRRRATDRLLVDVDDGIGCRSAARAASRSRRRSPMRARRRRAPDAVGGRPLSRVHRRHHRTAEGCAVAAGRRLRRRDGRRRGRDRRDDRRDGRAAARRSGSRRRRSCTGPRSGPCSPRCTTAAQSCSTTTPRRSTRARSSRRPRASMRTLLTIVGDAYARPIVDELRAATLRPLVVAAARDRRRDDRTGLQARAARAAART